MNEPPVTPLQVPGPPPPLNRARLWISGLVPPGVMVVFTVLFIVLANVSSSRSIDTLFTLLCVLTCLVTAACWALYINTLSRRFRGGSLVLLILAYPLIQGILFICIVFAGCIGILYTAGY